MSGLGSKFFARFFSSRVFSTFVPALLIAVVTIYVLAFRPEVSQAYGNLPGKPLAAYADLYPVLADNDGHLYLDKARFVNAIESLTKSPSPKAISDLIYLGQANNVTLMLGEEEKGAYRKLMDNPSFADMGEINRQRDRVFQVYKDIVNGIGQTFAGTGIEIVLHDTRDPLHSVVAIQNPISGRRLGDTNTNFGLELIKNYSVVDRQGSSFVSYGLKLKDGRQVKSTTVPLFNETFGLVGFICINIDISKLDVKQNPQAVAGFLDSVKLINNNDKISELIENSKRKRVVAEKSL